MFYTKLRRTEAQAAILRRRAEARLESLRFLETTTAKSEQSEYTTRVLQSPSVTTIY